MAIEKLRALPAAVVGAFILGGSVTVSAQESTDLFEQLDQNGDDKISKKEADIYPALKRQFDTLDANNDGALSPSELANLRQQRRQQGGGGPGGNPGGGQQY